MSGSLSPRTAQSSTGLPLAISRSPAPDLARHVARFFITRFDQGDDAVLEDFLLNEWAYIRVPIGDGWSARSGRDWVPHEGPLLFGAQCRPFRVQCKGPVMVAGFGIRPAAWFSFCDRSAHALADRLEPVTGSFAARLRWACADVTDHEQTFARMEQVVRAIVRETAREPDPIAERFEVVARHDPARSVAGICRALDVPQQRLERRVRNHFGHMPKTVLRRSRFLDMAAVMRGLAIPDADALAAMRYYDQSHLNREVRLFADMTPAKFRAAMTPLLTAGIEVRQQFKLFERDQHPADALPPWVRPAFPTAP
jgi:Helix-turn-helix domain